MQETRSELRYARFGAFEADLRTGELLKNGVKLKFSGVPFQILAILLERPGDLVTREELQNRVWPDTIVDVERNLNTAINRIREVLGDGTDTPRFIETLPRRGYRFIAAVETASQANTPPLDDRLGEPNVAAIESVLEPIQQPLEQHETIPKRRDKAAFGWIAALSCIAIGIAAAGTCSVRCLSRTSLHTGKSHTTAARSN